LLLIPEKDMDKDIEIYEPVGCPECDDTGFRGRIAVYEIMQITPEIKRMIVDNARTEDIKQQAVKDGMHTLRMSAAECVLKGTTDIKSLLKVSYEG
jgi:type IV pilus assembly protein PilB